MMKRIGFFGVVLAIGFLLAPGRARADEAATQPDLLGETYSSQAFGISFQPPRDTLESHPFEPDSIVEFDRDDTGNAWRVKVWAVRLEVALPLSLHPDQFGATVDGVLEKRVIGLQAKLRNPAVIRDEVINVGKVRVGMIAMRYDALEGKRQLLQEAIVEIPDASNRLYYCLELDAPGKPAGMADDAVDPREKLEYDTFCQMIDTVRLSDRQDVREDQMVRLLHTRQLFLNWTADREHPIRAAIVPEQWLRLRDNGKDVGYTYIVESLEQHGSADNQPTLRIGVRSHMVMSPDAQNAAQMNQVKWDSELWMTCGLDSNLTTESWWETDRCISDQQKVLQTVTQIGVSNEVTQKVVSQPISNGLDAGLSPQPQQAEAELIRKLDVTTQMGHTVSLKQDAPVFYVPRAISFILPTLLPLNSQESSYMFAEYVPNVEAATAPLGKGSVMARYMDVQPVTSVRLDGQDYQAVPIVDRLGLEGSKTTFYMSLDGRFLGSVSESTVKGITTMRTVSPTDAATLQKIWINPDLTKPREPGDIHLSGPATRPGR